MTGLASVTVFVGISVLMAPGSARAAVQHICSAGDKGFMGQYANKWLAKGLGWPFFVMVTAAAIAAVPLYLMTSGGQG